MVIKYKNKIYDSDDIPIFIFFKTSQNRKEFIKIINYYSNYNSFLSINSIHTILAGNTVIKDKRSPLAVAIKTREEKICIQKNLDFEDDVKEAEDINSLLLSPEDIDKDILEKWIMRYTEKIY